MEDKNFYLLIRVKEPYFYGYFCPPRKNWCSLMITIESIYGIFPSGKIVVEKWFTNKDGCLKSEWEKRVETDKEIFRLCSELDLPNYYIKKRRNQKWNQLK